MITSVALCSCNFFLDLLPLGGVEVLLQYLDHSNQWVDTLTGWLAVLMV